MSVPPLNFFGFAKILQYSSGPLQADVCHRGNPWGLAAVFGCGWRGQTRSAGLRQSLCSAARVSLHTNCPGLRSFLHVSPFFPLEVGSVLFAPWRTLILELLR